MKRWMGIAVAVLVGGGLLLVVGLPDQQPADAVKDITGEVVEKRPEELEGWTAIPIAPQPEPVKMLEVTIDEIYQAWAAHSRRENIYPWIRIKTAESLRVTGKLISFKYHGRSGILTLEGETPGNVLYVYGRAEDSSTDLTLWETHPDGRNARIVERSFKERVKIGDTLMVEGNLYYSNRLITDITRVHIRD